MILESLILLGFIFLLAALFHFKIKNFASRKKIPDNAGHETSISRPATARTVQSQIISPASGIHLQEPPHLDKLNQSNPKSVANLITHWVGSEPVPDPRKSTTPR